MARPLKTGIDYFPFNVDFFEDDKIMLIESEFGMKGGYIAVRLLCKIYKENYYYKWGADECLLFTKSLGADGVSKGLIDEVVICMVRRDFFDKKLFDKYRILTSRGIQKRYFEATRRYKNIEVIKEYLVIDVTNLDNVNINSINADTNTQKKRKGKESKPRGYINFSFDFIDEEFKDCFFTWLEYKHQRRETYKTQKSLELCYKKLLDKSRKNSVAAQSIVEQSMANNWAGLFELKEQKETSNEYKPTIHPALQ